MSDSYAVPSEPRWSVSPTPGLQINSVAVSDDGQRCIAGTSEEYGSGQFSVVCYNGDGSARWSAPFGGADSYQGVFWVAISADGARAAAGGETSKTAGLLTIYDGSTGAVIFSAAQTSRVNQLCFSHDGSTLLACFGNTLALYRSSGSSFALVATHDFSPFGCNSCALSADGTVAAVSSRNYDTGQGQVTSLGLSASGMTVTGSATFAAGAMRVAMTACGSYWAAAFHDGSCALFSQSTPNGALWSYRSPEPGLGVAYGIAVTQTSQGRVVVACGANLGTPATHGGLLYVVESVAGSATPLWQSYLQYSANPGVSLDTNALYVTATDGSPTQGGGESPGNFYLFNGASGAPVWTYPTATMNWPMVITPDGSAVLGGSDTGSVIYWSQAAK